MKIISTLFIGAISVLMLSAQTLTDDDLFLQMKKLDSLLFEEGFNHCRMDITNNLVHEELEFYHDQSGISNKQEFLDAVKNNICPEAEYKPIRKLVKESFMVFPLKNNNVLYGAIQQGSHDFYIETADQPLRYTSSGEFTHTWLLINYEWKLKTVLSYDHHYDSSKE